MSIPKIMDKRVFGEYLIMCFSEFHSVGTTVPGSEAAASSFTGSIPSPLAFSFSGPSGIG